MFWALEGKNGYCMYESVVVYDALSDPRYLATT